MSMSQVSNSKGVFLTNFLKLLSTNNSHNKNDDNNSIIINNYQALTVIKQPSITLLNNMRQIL